MAEQAAVQTGLFVTDPKAAFRDVRNYLAGRWVGGTRDEAILEEVVKCLFCRAYLERSGAVEPSQTLPPAEAVAEYQAALNDLADLLPGSFHEHDGSLNLDPEHVAYVDQQLVAISLSEATPRDPFGDVYEAFKGAVHRGAEGQFFTPQNAVDLLVTVVDPQPGEAVIDPACGAGTFLSTIARRWLHSGASADRVTSHLFGVDKDRYLADLASARLSLLTLQHPNVFCADSLAWASAEDTDFPLVDRMGEFDVVVTNPPFGSRIVSAAKSVRRTFDLGYRWEKPDGSDRLAKSSELLTSVPPQVLFVERCLKLVRPGGRVGMVVPESLVSGRKYKHVVQYIRDHAVVKAVLGMPEALFKTSGKGGTHTKTCLLVFARRRARDPARHDAQTIFMAEARWCGHDSRGRPIKYDDLPTILEHYKSYQEGALGEYDPLGYSLKEERLENHILAPRYYNKAVEATLDSLEATHRLVRLGDLFEAGLIEKRTGHEVGKLAYGTGPIPFVRTSDLSNWEIKVDPKHCVSESIYQDLAEKQDVQAGDILMVKDGTYLIGTCAFVTEYDERIVYQSHLYKLRSTDSETLSPYLLLALLSSPIVQRQIKTKQVTHDIIDSLGSRINDLILPIPKDAELQSAVITMVRQAIKDRVEARELAREACEMVTSPPESAK